MLPVSRAEVAEAAKLVENVYRAVNIALVCVCFIFLFFCFLVVEKKTSIAPSILPWCVSVLFFYFYFYFLVVENVYCALDALLVCVCVRL